MQDILESGLAEYVGTAKGDTIGVVVPNISADIRKALGTDFPALGALGARIGAGAQILAMDEAVKNTNSHIVAIFKPRDTKGGGGHGSLIIVGADDTADAKRAVETGVSLTDRFFGGIYICDAGHLEMQYTASAGEVVAKAFGAPIGSAFGLICACPGAIGMVTADRAIKAADTDILSVSTPDFGTTHTNEMILTVSGEASAVLEAVKAGRETGLSLLSMMGERPEPLFEPYF